MVYSKGTSDSSWDVGAGFVEIFKTSTKGFYNGTIEILLKNWTRLSSIFFKFHPSIPGKIPNIAISYKYNYKKVLRFISY